MKVYGYVSWSLRGGHGVNREWTDSVADIGYFSHSTVGAFKSCTNSFLLALTMQQAKLKANAISYISY